MHRQGWDYGSTLWHVVTARCNVLLLLLLWLIDFFSLFSLFGFWEHNKYLIVTEPRMTWTSDTLASTSQLLVFIPGVCHYALIVLCEGSVPGSIMLAKHSTNCDTKWIVEKGFSFHHKLTPVWMMLTRCCKQKLAPPHPTNTLIDRSGLGLGSRLCLSPWNNL